MLQAQQLINFALSEISGESTGTRQAQTRTSHRGARGNTGNPQQHAQAGRKGGKVRSMRRTGTQTSGEKAA